MISAYVLFYGSEISCSPQISTFLRLQLPAYLKALKGFKVLLNIEVRVPERYRPRLNYPHVIKRSLQLQPTKLPIKEVQTLSPVLNHTSQTTKQTNKLHGLSPRANYTDQATAACRRSDCQLLRIKGCHVISVTDPSGRILDFLDRSCYFSIK
jgi:hypothetical protein